MPGCGAAMASDFYLRYYVGHKGKFGHEFLEFEFRPDGESGAGGRGAGEGWGSGPRGPPAWFNAWPLPTGKLRYANNSNYKNDVMIRKEVRAARLRAFVPPKGTVGRARGWVSVLGCCGHGCIYFSAGMLCPGLRAQECDGGAEENNRRQ